VLGQPGDGVEQRVVLDRAEDDAVARGVLRAARPDACSDDALPVTASCSAIAAIASGTIGVVAAWSR
jgi:hypothetical protein